MRAAALALLVAVPAAAQEIVPPGVDCEAPADMEEALTCARAAYEAADADLDLAYRLALTQAKVLTERLTLAGTPPETPVGELLEQAQADWLPFRDAACAAEAYLGVPEAGELLALECLTRLTRRREGDLQAFGEVD